MRLGNTTSAQDALLRKAQDSYGILDDALDIVRDLDSQLTEARKEIKRLEAEVEDLGNRLYEAKNENYA